MPLRDRPMAVTDESYFDWVELPEAPSELILAMKEASVHLTGKIHGAMRNPSLSNAAVASNGQWETAAKFASQANLIPGQTNPKP